MRGRELDFCLSIGYFRMQQDIFTCRFVPFNDRFYAVHWLRLVLENVSYGKTQQRLLRLNAKFSVAVKPFVLSAELETLYARYRGAIDFDAPGSVEDCLLGSNTQNDFDTQVIEVRDGARLVAAGIFDNGAESIMGIMNFYHPDYRKYSLGKYLMLSKINHARSLKKKYYYPGYLVSGYPKFDYKLFPCAAATEVLNGVSGMWLPFSWEIIPQLSVGLIEEFGTGRIEDYG